MRYFNTSGPNFPADHYTLPRLDWIEKGKKLVYDQRGLEQSMLFFIEIF
jgi:hypothetical protein